MFNDGYSRVLEADADIITYTLNLLKVERKELDMQLEPRTVSAVRFLMYSVWCGVGVLLYNCQALNACACGGDYSDADDSLA